MSTPHPPARLTARGLSAGYPGRRVIEDLDLTIAPGKVTALIGANACGKSTLLGVLARLNAPLGGSVELDGTGIASIPRRRFAQTVGLLPQHPTAPEGITVAAGGLLLSGCSTPAESGSEATSVSDAAFPVTISHMYGETTIESAPERVATWGWGATDAVLALGIVPVAFGSMDYGGGDDKITPWVSDAIEELGGEAPTVLDSTAAESVASSTASSIGAGFSLACPGAL